jgi:hypothetical protein
MPNEAAGLETQCIKTNTKKYLLFTSPIKSGRVCAHLLVLAHFWHLQCRPSDLMGFLFLVEYETRN